MKSFIHDLDIFRILELNTLKFISFVFFILFIILLEDTIKMHKPKKFKEKVKVLEVNTPKVSQKKQINLFDIPEIFDSEGNFNLNLYLILRSETLDNFSFNRITSNRSFTPTFIDFNNHTITFKPFDRESALLLPDRLGFYKFDTMASLIRNITTYNAGDLEKVKDILIYSYKISYGVELDREKIVFKISNNRIWKVTYNSKNLETLVKVSTEISDNWSQEKVRSLKSTRSYRSYVYKKNLFIPPSIDLTQGLKIPFDGIYSSAKLRTQIQKN